MHEKNFNDAMDILRARLQEIEAESRKREKKALLIIPAFVLGLLALCTVLILWLK